jgi:hypothetical protein
MRSPIWRVLTSAPKACITPTTWCPNTTGKRGGGVRPSISSSSVWQTPQTDTLIKTSFGPGIGAGNSLGSKGCEFSWSWQSFGKIMAFIEFFRVFIKIGYAIRELGKAMFPIFSNPEKI